MPYLFDYLPLVEEMAKRSPFGVITGVYNTSLNRHLSSLSRRLPLVAAVSEGPVQELRESMATGKILLMGYNGLERWVRGRVELWEGAQVYLERVEASYSALESLIDIEGVSLSRRSIWIIVDYSKAPFPEEARRSLLRIVADSTLTRDLQVVEDSGRIELHPPFAVDKGFAVRALVKEFKLRGALYLGGQAQDVGAFTAVRYLSFGESFKGLSVAVMDEASPLVLEKNADCSLAGIRDVERFLAWVDRQTARPSKGQK